MSAQYSKPVSQEIALDYPFTHDGYLYDRIVLRRLTTRQVAVYVSSLQKKVETQADEPVNVPMYFRADGAPVPDEVIQDCLIDDDTVRLEAVAMDFLPRRFRDSLQAASTPDPVAEALGGTGPATGADTGQTSSE